MMTVKERTHREFIVFAVLCGGESGLALSCLGTGNLLLSLPLIFASLIGCWSICSPAGAILKVSIATHSLSALVIGAIAGYSYYGEDMISVPESSIWMIALSLSLTLAITAASRKALLKWRELEELQWKTPCGPDVEACRSPVNDEDHQPVHANFECVLQVPDSMFNSEVPSDGTMIPVTLTLEEPRSSTPEMSAIREPIQYPRTSLTSPGPSASDFQSCKSNNAINPKRYSHGDKAAATPPRAAGQSKIASYFGQHLSPRPPWLLMPARPSEREVHSDHV